MKFDQLGLSPKALAAVTAVGFEEPTPIQEKAIPVVLAGGDVLGLAQTGTGKTASFTLPILTRLESGRARARMPRILILEPTRELAAQVHESFELLGADHKLTIALLIGGVSFADQDRKLGKGADVLIATPGRLLDHFERGKLMLNGVEVLVVDEADRMLDMGFIPDIERICKLLPLTRQTLFFSATMPPEIQRITKAFLHNPTQIEASPRSSVVSTITQSWVKTPSEPKAKRAMLRDLIASEQVKNAIVFCNRKRDVATLERSCERHKLNARALHGDMNQHARLETLQQFRDGEITYLIASDVAARGLDIPDVSHIFNFDVPDYPEDYIHRIGRTGRAGKEGHAFSLVTPPDMKKIAAIEKLIETEIAWHGLAPSSEETEQSDRGGRRGRRRGKDKDTARKPSERGKDKYAGRQRSERDQPKAEGEAEAETEAAAPEQEEPRRDPPRKPRKRAEEGRSRGRKKREDSVVGLGDHVPAFLQRSPRR
ncbi:MAG: DEAD/DEAH box helicase [Hyphomicrobiales bacterium]